jgi:hypothetical protein
MNPNLFPNLDPAQQDKLARKMQDIATTDPEIGPQAPQGSQVARDTLMQPEAIFPDRQADNLKNRIKALQDELDETPVKVDIKQDDTFRDASGNETYYVKNVCGRIVMLTDMGRKDNEVEVKILVGDVADLTTMAPMDELRRSRDLRKATLGLGQEQTLKRLTEVEFFEEMRRKVSDKKKLDIVRQQEELRRIQQVQNPGQEVLPHERPAIGPFAQKDVRPVLSLSSESWLSETTRKSRTGDKR